MPRMPWSRPAGLSGVGGLAAAAATPKITEAAASNSARRTNVSLLDSMEPCGLAGVHAGDRVSNGLRYVFQGMRVREGPQLLQRLVLDLADALPGHVERAAHLVERARVLAVQAVAQLEHPALAMRQRAQDLLQRLLAHRDLGRLVGQRHVLVGEEVAELRLLLVAHRFLERDGGLRAAHDLLDLLLRQVEVGRDLV